MGISKMFHFLKSLTHSAMQGQVLSLHLASLGKGVLSVTDPPTDPDWRIIHNERYPVQHVSLPQSLKIPPLPNAMAQVENNILWPKGWQLLSWSTSPLPLSSVAASAPRMAMDGRWITLYAQLRSG